MGELRVVRHTDHFDEGCRFYGDILGWTVTKAWDEPSPGRVPDRNGEHPVEVLHTGRPEILVEVDDDFAIRSRAKDMPPGFQLSSKLQKVVDLAVEHHPDGTIFVRHRLMACRREVEDGQSTVDEAGARRRPVATVVGSSVAQRVGHPLENRGVDRPSVILKDHSADATHA